MFPLAMFVTLRTAGSPINYKFIISARKALAFAVSMGYIFNFGNYIVFNGNLYNHTINRVILVSIAIMSNIFAVVAAGASRCGSDTCAKCG